MKPRPKQPFPPAPPDPRQLELPGVTRYAKPAHVTIRYKDGTSERVLFGDFPDWLERREAERTRKA